MSTFVLTDASVLLGGVGLTGKSNSISLTYEVETQDNTVFGNDTRTNAAGLFALSGEVGGFTDDSITGSTIFDAVGAGPSVFQVAAPGDDGTKGYAFKSMAASTQPLGGSVGEMAADSISLVGKSGAPLVNGTILHALTARTATGTGTGRELGAVLSTESVYGALNITAASGTTPTLDVIVQSDDNSDFTTPTTRLTFSQQTAAGADWQSAAGAITDTHWRVSFTIGGTSPSFTFQVLVGIR